MTVLIITRTGYIAAELGERKVLESVATERENEKCVLDICIDKIHAQRSSPDFAISCTGHTHGVPHVGHINATGKVEACNATR